MWAYMMQVWPNLVASAIWGPVVMLTQWFLHRRQVEKLEAQYLKHNKLIAALVIRMKDAIQEREAAKVSMVETPQASEEVVRGSQSRGQTASSTNTSNETREVDQWEQAPAAPPQSTT